MQYTQETLQRFKAYGASLLPFSQCAMLVGIKAQELAQWQQDFYTAGAPLYEAYWLGNAEFVQNTGNAQLSAIFAQYAPDAQPQQKNKLDTDALKTHHMLRATNQKTYKLDTDALKTHHMLRATNQKTYNRERRRWELEQSEAQQS